MQTVAVSHMQLSVDLMPAKTADKLSSTDQETKCSGNL